MDTIEIALSVKKNGIAIEGSPFIRRVNVDEMQQFEVEQATASGFVTLPITSIDVLQFILLQPDQQVIVRLAAQSDAGFVLNANSLLLILDGLVGIAAATNVTVSNNSGQTALLKGTAGGT